MFNRFRRWIWGLNTSYHKWPHPDDAGWDLEVRRWVWVDNPLYSGNIFQSTGWYECRRSMIKDAHKG